jgi:hypothetical protein
VEANLVLTSAPPTVGNPGGEVLLGELHRGIFLVTAYPAWLDFGGIVEVTFEPEDLGVHEVELAGTVVGTTESHVLANWPLEIPPAESGWLAPRTWSFPVPIEFGVYGDVDMALEIRVDRASLARRCILVRSFSL